MSSAGGSGTAGGRPQAWLYLLHEASELELAPVQTAAALKRETPSSKCSCSVGKGRDMGFDSINSFESKASGCCQYCECCEVLHAQGSFAELLAQEQAPASSTAAGQSPAWLPAAL